MEAGRNENLRALAGLVFGALFGFLISWGQFTDPDRIRDMLLLEDLYLYGMMFSAMAVAMAGTAVLTRLRARAVLTGEPVAVSRQRPAPRHLIGAALFGLGWALTDSCPAPIAGQLAQGVLWSTATIAGVLFGVLLFLRRAERSVAVG